MLRNECHEEVIEHSQKNVQHLLQAESLFSHSSVQSCLVSWQL